MEQLGKTKQTSRKPAHQKKPQNHSSQAVFYPEILSAAASAAEHSLSESLLGVSPEQLLSAGISSCSDLRAASSTLPLTM